MTLDQTKIKTHSRRTMFFCGTSLKKPVMKTSYRQAERRALQPVLGACALILTFGLTGCSTPKVRTEHNSSTNFSRYKTFAVLPLSTSGPGADPGAALRLAQPAEQAVRDALAAKGMTEAPRDKADCAVRVRGESLPRVEVSNWGYTAYPVGLRRGGWVYHGGYTDTDVRTTEERKLIVEVFDNASHQEVWVGWTEHAGSGPVQPDKLQAGIRKILEGFPPAAKAP